MSDYETFDPNSKNIVSRVVLEHKPVTNKRTIARRIVLQVLYEIDCVGHAVGFVMTHHFDYSADARKSSGYIHRLVVGIEQNHEVVDQILQKYAPEWPIGQVAIIDRNILRIALYEMGIDATPVSVVIDEAVESAKVFGAEGAPRFVNGVLGTIANNLDTVRDHLSLHMIISDDTDPITSHLPYDE